MRKNGWVTLGSGDDRKERFLKMCFYRDNQEGIAKDDEGNLYMVQDSGGILKVEDLH